MPSVCFYFQVHQPLRVRRFTYFESSNEFDYFDEAKNREIIQKVARKSYLPTNQMMLDLIERYQGAFRIAYSISGVMLEQIREYSPETLESFQRLANTGCVEFLAETYYHSLAAVYDEDEFKLQVQRHEELIQELFGQTPTVFRNTELIYNDRVGELAAEMGYKAILAEGPADILEWRSPSFVYSHPDADIKLLLKNYQLADDVAFRFSNREWENYPLTSETFASWVHRISGCGDVVNLFMDYETFGEHQWEDTGIFDFMWHLPEMIFRHPDWSFCTPSEAVDRYPAVSPLWYHRLTSWADVDRDLTAWQGNSMQRSALWQLYQLGEEIKDLDDPVVLDVWRKLQTSDHFYYMCTKWSADGDVHAYFSPFESPYDAFINYMNAFRDLKRAIEPKVEIVPEVLPDVAQIVAAQVQDEIRIIR